jgi:hypothetical protein
LKAMWLSSRLLRGHGNDHIVTATFDVFLDALAIIYGCWGPTVPSSRRVEGGRSRPRSMRLRRARTGKERLQLMQLGKTVRNAIGLESELRPLASAVLDIARTVTKHSESVTLRRYHRQLEASRLDDSTALGFRGWGVNDRS